ncbi:SAGA complex protein [Lentinula aciculospora]|uniref:SAGA complex protein n=1 Tax=Lentinula aciculospora TaxID=153920 RepID=A0A9W9A199_9AGAR|nr:SAGA complex protein [Lentinula aciculospora]
MNNLLKTLSDSKVKTLLDVDLRSLLTTVKDGRGRRDDNALSNAFYESLEGVLADLKTVTIDNHDAEAFLKPVLKAEVADYYEVISNPMDFQSMGKKLKARQYKSKKEFKDDLDLIWSNCCTYNSTEGHHLPKAARRLKAKADKLLANITDRKERADPHIPYDFSSSGALHPKINGINGRAHTRSPSVASSSSSKLPTITIKTSSLAKAITKIPRRDTSFEESPALIRTVEGMSLFRDLDRRLHQQQTDPSSSTSDIGTRMRELVPSEYEDEYDSEAAQLGDKRKVNGINDHRAHKRARFVTPLPISDSTPSSPTSTSKDDELTQLWWTTVQSDALFPNGLPEISVASSSSQHPFLKPPIPKYPAQTAKKKKKARKKLPASYRPENKPKALLTLMNNNVRTIKRVRHTHARFAALGLTKDTGTGNEDGEVGDATPGFNATTAVSVGPSLGTGGLGADPMDVEEAVDDRVDERPWGIPTRRGRKLSGIEMGSENADDCLRWMNGKVLEHAGFQGTSKTALDVLSGVASEYLLNVGRTIKFLGDKFAHTMSPEEIILHTLFESGISEIQDLERYVADDVERYGSRLADLEKKLVGAYREVTSVETLEDEGLFDEEEEDETSALALGEFADTLGVDYLGLRELGIAEEFGMSSLTIPKRLLKGKKRKTNLLPIAKPTEPPPPFPPPPPFIPLTAGQIPEQIGILHKFYHERLQAVVPPPAPAIPHLAPPLLSQLVPPLALPALPGPSLGNPYPNIPSIPKPSIPALPGPPRPSGAPTPVPNSLPQTHNIVAHISSSSFKPPSDSLSQPQSPPPTETVIPDDPPLPAQVKMGPVGQIVKTGSSYPAAKKKAKGATGTGANNSTTSTSNKNNNNGSDAITNAYPPNINTDTNDHPLSATLNRPSSGVLTNGSLVNGIVKPEYSLGPGSGPMNLIGDSNGGFTFPVSGASTMSMPIATDGSSLSGSTPSPKKKKGATGVGTGNGRKKRMLDAAQGQAQTQAQAQSQAHTHSSQNQPGQGRGQDPRPPPFPPFVAASA